jgi:hypothetical protein
MKSFCILKNILKIFLIYIFMRCLSYRLIKIHRKFTSAYLLCDKASLTMILAMILSSFGSVNRKGKCFFFSCSLENYVFDEYVVQRGLTIDVILPRCEINPYITRLWGQVSQIDPSVLFYPGRRWGREFRACRPLRRTLCHRRLPASQANLEARASLGFPPIRLVL